MQYVKVKNFSSREELEKHIISKYGRNVDLVPNVYISGTVLELKNKLLSNGAKMWGVTVKATNYSPPKKVVTPTRGKKIKSSLNGQQVSIKKKKK